MLFDLHYLPKSASPQMLGICYFLFQRNRVWHRPYFKELNNGVVRFMGVTSLECKEPVPTLHNL